MSSDLHQHAEQIFSEAIDRNGSARIAYLEEACMDDSELREEVESLISHYETTEGMLTPPSEASHELTTGMDDAFNISRTGADGETLIGSYRIIKTVQDNERGTSYLVEQDSPAQHCMLDLYHPLPERSGSARRFRVLGDQLQQFEGYGLPSVLETGTTDTGRGQQPFMVTRYVESSELLAYATSQDVGVRRKVELLRDACRILVNVHALGVVHGDLRPATVRVDTEGQVIILDTGIALSLGLEMSILPAAGGTMEAECRAPESTFGTRDARGDVHAMGVIGAAMLDGGGDHGLGAVLDRAMNPDPSERYQSMDALAAELGRWLDGKPLEAGGDTFFSEIQGIARRHPVASTCIIILEILLITACLMFISLDRGTVAEPMTGSTIEQPADQKPAGDPGTGPPAGNRQ